MDITTVINCSGLERRFRNARPYVLFNGSLRIYESGSRGADKVVAEYSSTEWKSVATTHEEPQEDIDWQDLAEDLGEALDDFYGQLGNIQRKMALVLGRFRDTAGED